MTDITISAADTACADDIAELERQYIDCPWSVEQVKAEIAKPNVIFLAARCGGKTVGYVSGEAAADEIEFGNIAVDSAFRRQGVATRLLRALVEQAQSGGVKKIFLLVSASNTSAKALYEKVGFISKGIRKSYYGNTDAIIMELEI